MEKNAANVKKDPFALAEIDLQQQAKQFEDWQEQNRPLIEEAGKNGQILTLLKREKAKEEMLQYLTGLVNGEYGGVTEEDALDHWQLYKENHGIDLR